MFYRPEQGGAFLLSGSKNGGGVHNSSRFIDRSARAGARRRRGPVRAAGSAAGAALRRAARPGGPFALGRYRAPCPARVFASHASSAHCSCRCAALRWRRDGTRRKSADGLAHVCAGADWLCSVVYHIYARVQHGCAACRTRGKLQKSSLARTTRHLHACEVQSIGGGGSSLRREKLVQMYAQRARYSLRVQGLVF